jgi:DNA polymerase-1
VRTWLDQSIAGAHEHGYVDTMVGRRRKIPELTSGDPATRAYGERIAANTPIQGSAADLCKLAMLGIARRVREEGLAAAMVLQIHDELLFEVEPSDLPRLLPIVRHEMEHVWPALRVPLVVDLGHGASWEEAHG